MSELTGEQLSERSMFRIGAAPAPHAVAVASRPLTPMPVRPARIFRPAQLLAAASRKCVALPAAVRSAAILEIERGAPFLVVPVLFAAGGFFYFSLSFEPNLLLTLLAAAVTIFTLWRSRRALHFAVFAILLFELGVLAAQIETWRVGTKIIGSEISTRIVGQVVAVEELSNGRGRLTIDLISTERPKLHYAPDRIRATARKVPEGIQAGSVVSGLVKLRPPSGPVRPESYDFSFESYFDGIGASGYFMRGPELAQGAPAKNAWASFFERTRQGIAEHVRERIKGPEGEIAAALMVGVTGGIPHDVSEALRRTGLYHIISISGLHMALVAGVVIAAIRLGFALLPGFSSRWPATKFSAAAGLAAIAGYLAISGGEVAAQRSFLMLAVMLIAVLFDRAALTMRNLAISAMIVLAISPHEVVGPSFQMSFAATTALVAAYAMWSGRKRRSANSRSPASYGFARRSVRHMTVLFVSLVATSVVAGLATAAYGAFHFQRVAPLSLFANLIAMPIVSIIVMPCAVIAAITMPAGLDGPFLDLMGWGIGAMNAVASWFSKHSPVDAVGLIPGHSVVLITIALLIVTVLSTWLRWASVPVALAGILTLGNAPEPDVLVAEDGRLAGFRAEDGTLAVNRLRPNAFTAENWKRAIGAERFRQPVLDPDVAVEPSSDSAGYASEPHRSARQSSGQAHATSGTERGSDRAPRAADDIVRVETIAFRPRTGHTNAGSSGNAEARSNHPLEGESIDGFSEESEHGNNRNGNGQSDENPFALAFQCDEITCVGRLRTGGLVVHTSNAEEARVACAFAAVIILDDATLNLSCANPAIAVVNKRQLARHGSASIYLSHDSRNDSPHIRYAIGDIDRPWHRHRAFSREARGLPPYRPKPPPARIAGDDIPVNDQTAHRESPAK